ncbi:MAG: NUDIX hydrolase [Tomitella sp.]|nr:NUDIX hydrolase [Tomitella sp.]
MSGGNAAISTGDMVRAAGTVLWRRRTSPGGGSARDHGRREIALIHRPEYDDWSLPKGKLDAGEALASAAVRETWEETGYSARLGRYLQAVTYPLSSPRRTKRVDYWEAQAVDGDFHANSEVDELRWLRFSDAVEMLTHDVDRAVLARFRARRPGDATLVVIRHTRAGRRGHFDGPDTDRPLDAKGRKQAKSLVPQTAAFGPTVVHAADRVRCVDTVAPFAKSIGADVVSEPTLSEEAYAQDPGAARARMVEIASGGATAAVCSQSGVIPDLLRWWADRDGVDIADTSTKKAESWVLTLRRGALIAADPMCPPAVSA